MKADPDLHPAAAEWLDGTATEGTQRLLRELLHEPGAAEEFAALARTDALLCSRRQTSAQRRAALEKIIAGPAWPLRALSAFRRPPVSWTAAAAAVIALAIWALWPAPAPEPEPAIARKPSSPQLMPVANSGRHAPSDDDAAPLPPADKSVESWLRRYYVKPLPLTGDLPTAAKAIAAAIKLEDGSHLAVDTQAAGDAPVHVKLGVSLPAWTLLDLIATQTGTEVQLSGRSLVFRKARKPAPREGSQARSISQSNIEGFLGGPLSQGSDENNALVIGMLAKEYLGVNVALTGSSDDSWRYSGTPRDVLVLTKALNAAALPLWRASLLTKVVELPRGLLPELLAEQGLPNGQGIHSPMHDEQFQLLMRALPQRRDVDILTAPSLVTGLGQKAVLSTKGKEENDSGVVCEFEVLADSSSQLDIHVALRLDLWDEQTKSLSTQELNSNYTVPNGMTVAISGMSGKDGREVVFFITGALVDPLEKNPPQPAEPVPAPPADDLPYGIPVPDKPGFVRSPYAGDKGFVDVDGLPRGTKVRCPFTSKHFRVP